MDSAAIKEATEIFGEQAGEFIRLTLKDADNFMAEIVTETTNGNAVAVGLAAHSLKSILKQVGAEDVAAIAYEIEKAGHAGDIALCRARVGSLEVGYGELRTYLVAHRGQTGTPESF
jgi:HPt (histidine-containing phosphotransfer) domain-containing protein